VSRPVGRVLRAVSGVLGLTSSRSGGLVFWAAVLILVGGLLAAVAGEIDQRLRQKPRHAPDTEVR
jgi:4-hydroxybenzoate polyprenyltransferase